MQMAASAISAPPNATRCRCLPLGTRVPMARSVPPRVGSGRPLHGTDLAARRGRTSSYMEWTVLTAVEEREGRGSFGFGSGRAYHYGEESFRHRTSTRHGKFRVLERFTYELLAEAAGMYCIAVLEVAHHAFLQHSHYDADEAMCDSEGKSIVVLLYRTRELGLDVMVLRPLPSCTWPTHSFDWFCVLMLFSSMSTPGTFQEFFPVSGERPESFFRFFSDDVIPAVFNIWV